ncbi:ATP-dependent acyl-CoA ligase [Sciscionella sediminilitoris]|uniref:ATP-dependent acyl-CoA ligase n=1 Tax=Sciscionella sediminilitoris TaxID=1445613 RepID=UPI0004DF541E|nr:ATP-dependent acyl-CoA ligase [Sciscionella sp. SE31]
MRGLPLSECTLPALLERQANRFGDRDFLRIGELRRSYAQVRDAAAVAGGTLAAQGIRRGDQVAVLATNRVELLDTVLGCAWIGAVAVPLNTALRGEGLRHALADSGSRLLIAETSLIRHLALVERPERLETVWALDGIPEQPPPGYQIVPVPEPAGPVVAAPVEPGETMTILYTSGTTGPAKGVCCPQAQLYWWGVHVTEALGIVEGDVLYTCLPLFHTNALNAFGQALVAGAEYVLGQRFSASGFLGELADSGATVTYLLGAMVNILYSRPESAADRAHRARVALAPATPASLQRPFTERFGITLVDGFGATETNMVIGAGPREQRPGYLGPVRAGFEARVVDEHDAEVPDGTPGELVLRHEEPFAFATGYHGRPETTVEQWRNLWFHTGDRVIREPDGWFRFLDRIKDAIRRRGENISSFEVEQAVGLHPAVQNVAAFAVPSELAEDEVMVAVLLEPEQRLTAEELTEFCSARLAYFAVPRYIEFVTELPLTANGKVRKSVLRERGRTPRTWDREAAGYQLSR